ncbi:MAG TPA: 23S rRNA (pseudouridine(1915)-N(3))-methyltransferase RlmH [Gemmatimonadaceae bacterium]|nr:23S rRNA (pseudouridine(1915)-N(3))-methyltransferase RlmH [Gemmatimonadaceae bacterium]
MHFLVAAVGKPRDANLAGAIAEYETRAARYWPLRVQEVREEPARSSAPELVREREGERLLHVLPPGAQVVACDVNGRTMASEQFARWLQDLRERAVDVVFVIGGAFGLGHEVKERAFAAIALAPWTLPHELARLVLAEQLYRAGTIVRREPYHK